MLDKVIGIGNGIGYVIVVVDLPLERDNIVGDILLDNSLDVGLVVLELDLLSFVVWQGALNSC